MWKYFKFAYCWIQASYLMKRNYVLMLYIKYKTKKQLVFTENLLTIFQTVVLDDKIKKIILLRILQHWTDQFLFEKGLSLLQKIRKYCKNYSKCKCSFYL